MNDPILVVMAAGIGSRFGGLKQMTPVGARGESIVEYSLYDALRAGFERVVFIVSPSIRDDFERMIGARWSKKMDVRYAVQSLSDLPDGFALPQGRQKPWGTGHAVLSAAPYVNAPFAAINADDFYGAHAYRELYSMLTDAAPAPRPRHCMVGYPLENTLTENGSVARGVCTLRADGTLGHIVERTHIISTCDGPLYTLDNQTYERLPRDAVVSLNLWGFDPSMMDELKARFPVFLRNAAQKNPFMAEFFLPSVVCDLIDEGKADVRVRPSPDRWYGVTHRADLAGVQAAIAAMTRDGLYPEGLA